MKPRVESELTLALPRQNKGRIKSNVFAILHEPAQYTTDRNHEVYERMGVHYTYMHGHSEAKSDEGDAEKSLSELSFSGLVAWTWQLLKKNDVIIMNGYTNRVFMCMFVLNVFFGRAIGIDSDTPLSIPSNFFKRLLKATVLNTIFRNRHVYGLAGGTNSHKELFRHYGMKNERIFLMPMMVDNAKFYPSSAEKSEIPFVFLYVGRIVECKNIGVMLEAFVQAFGNSKEVQMHVVGGGDMQESYKGQYIKQENILFLGKRFGKDLVGCYHQAHVFVLPSSYEPWGLVVNEAMAAGLPVIVSDKVGAGYDLVETCGSGFVFRYDDVAALSEQMKKIASDKKLYDELSRNAYRRMHDEWNYEFYADCLKKFIEYAAKK